MLKNLFIIFCTIFTSFAHAQLSDLNNLANGEITNFQTLFDKKDKVFGYAAVYDLGKIDKFTKKFQFYIFDKNLNQILNQEVKTEAEVINFSAFIDMFGTLKVLPYSEKGYEPNYKKYAIDIYNNTIKEYHNECYIEGKMEVCKDELNKEQLEKKRKLELKYNGSFEDADVYNLENKEKFVIKNNYAEKKRIFFSDQFEAIKYDVNNAQVWTFKDEKSLVVNENRNYYTLHYDTTCLQIMRFNYLKKDFKSADFMCIDMKTGKLLNITNNRQFNEETYLSFNNMLSGTRTKYIGNTKEYQNNMQYIAGKMSNTTTWKTLFKERGIVKMVFDKKGASPVFSEFVYTDLKKWFPEISTEGNLNGFSPVIIDVFQFDNGKITLLYEQFKIGSDFWKGQVPIVDDLMLVDLDENLKVTSAELVAKQKTKNAVSEYLYSQFINDDKDVVFFYIDDIKNEKTGKKDIILYINKITGDELIQDEMPITSKTNSIYPKIAKEGYILLREYNKEAKYNQVRLEKLNF